MPRIPRGEMVGGIYHIINRGNMQMQVFDDMEDYEYFLDLLEKASKRENVEVHAYCLVQTTTLIRYIEANAARAKLVRNAEDWDYSSLMEREHKHRTLLSEPYMVLDDD